MQQRGDFGPSLVVYREPKLSLPKSTTGYEKKRSYYGGYGNCEEKSYEPVWKGGERGERYSRIMEELGGIEDTISSILFE